MRLDSQEFDMDIRQHLAITVQNAVACLDHIPVESEMNFILGWPLWQIGVCCQKILERSLIVERLLQIRVRHNKRSLDTIINFLNSLWDLKSKPAYASYKYRHLLALVTHQCDRVIFF